MDEKYFEEMLDSVDFAVAEHELIYDEKGMPTDYKYHYANSAFCNNVGKKHEEIIGKTVYELFPETEPSWVERYNNVVETGKATQFVNYSTTFDQYFSVYSFKSGENRFVTSFKNITSIVKVSEPGVKGDIIANIFNEGKTAYFEFNLKQRKFEYSDTLSSIIGLETITYEDYTNLFSKYTHPADKKRVTKVIESIFKEGNNEIVLQMRFFNQVKNEYVWISYFAYIEKRYRNVPVVIKGLIKDIDEDKRKALEIENINKLFRETRKIANIAVFYYNFEKSTFNHSVEFDEFTGIQNLRYLEQMRKIVHPDDLWIYDDSTERIKQKTDGVVSNYRVIKNNDVRYIQTTVFADVDESGKVIGVFGITRDNTEMQKSKLEIEYFANHDVLTGLYNRNYFEVYAKKIPTDKKTCLIICDVDGLKLVNDAFGHIEGDELLVYLAKTLQKIAKDNTVFRIGGDEFVIIVNDANDETPIEMERAIHEEIRKFKTYGVGFDASIGYSFLTEGGFFEDAFRQAENLMYRRKLTERKSRKSTALSTIMQTMHEKTEETEEHCSRVGELSASLLRDVGKKRDYEIEEIKLVADLHDIGKISISDKILSKPDTLTKDEYEKIKYHSESGYKIISNIIDNDDIAVAVLYHHERWDGKGYPHNLKGEDIPLYSRIVSICDAYDAMTNDRVYREPLTKKQAIKEIKNNAGTQFDPELVEKFIKIIKNW